MHVSVNGVRLFFDVEGAKFARPRWRCTGSQGPMARATGSTCSRNMFPDLGRIQCLTWCSAARTTDHPIESQADIAAALPPHSCSSNGSRIAATA